MDSALDAMRVILGDRDGRERAARQSGIPTAQEYSDALSRLGRKVGEPHWLMLRALFAAPDRTLTATQLAACAGYSGYANANDKFSKFARMVAEDLGYDPDLRPDGSPIWISTLATGDPEQPENKGEWHWTMRKEVADCMVMMNLVAAPCEGSGNV
jgi:hypothetical protein